MPLSFVKRRQDHSASAKRWEGTQLNSKAQKLADEAISGDMTDIESVGSSNTGPRLQVSTQGFAAFKKIADEALTASGEFDSNKKLRQSQEFTVNKLHFPEGELVGRKEEIGSLQASFKALKSARDGESDRISQVSTLISISGYSGTGKTVLAKSLQPDVTRSDGFFCLGKFDLKSSLAPYTAFASAFENLADQILARGEAFTKEIGAKIRDAVGAEIQVLLQVMPGLSKILSLEPQSSVLETSVDQKKNQLHHIARKLVQVLCQDGRPLVLVLDDVQWADQGSLDMAEALLTDSKSAFMIIASSRSNELSDEHPFVQKMEHLKELDSVIVESVPLTNLDYDSVGVVVAEALRSTTEVTKSLSEVVFDKTHGNAFFVVQFLISLVDEGHLTYNFGSMDWLWDDGLIQSLSVSDNVVDLLAAKIDRLSSGCRLLLQVAACIGQELSEVVLVTVFDHLLNCTDLLGEGGVSMADLAEACAQCVEAGLLEQHGSKLAFTHDQIQSAAFHLVPQDRLSRLQLEIGRCLMQEVIQARFDGNVLFMAVDLYNCGLGLLDVPEKLLLAGYNVDAADKSISKSAFSSSVQYVDAGLRCLESLPASEKSQDFRFRLSVAGSDAAYCLGDFETMRKTYGNCNVEPPAVPIKVSNLGMVTNVSANPSTLTVVKELLHTKRVMKKWDKAALCNLPETSDKKRQMAMELIYNMVVITYTGRPNLFLILFLKAVRWALKYGVTEYTPAAFAVYGLILCGVDEDFKFGNHARKWEIWLPQLALMSYMTLRAFHSGAYKLDELATLMQKHKDEMCEYKQDLLANFEAIALQSVLNLMGKSENPLVLSGTAMDLDAMKTLAKQSENVLLGHYVEAWSAQVTYMYEDYALSMKHFKASAGFGKTYNQGQNSVVRYFFYRGLACAAMAQEGVAVDKNLSEARKTLKVMRRWLKKGCVNVNHTVKLLEAEIAAVQNKADVSQLYEEAARAAGHAGYINDKALAHARAGRYFSAVQKDSFWAAYHLDQAVENYSEWGANGLSNHLVTKYKAILETYDNCSNLTSAMLSKAKA